MDILQLLSHKDLPENFLQTYGRFICKHKRLQNGWHAVMIYNGYTFFLHASNEDFSVPTVKKVNEASDGKFMLTLKRGQKIIYSADGRALTSFDEQTQLYPNGWYQVWEKEHGLCLYDADDKCRGRELHRARVFKNGHYFTSVKFSNNRCLSSVFTAEGRELYASSAPKFTVLPNGWFVANHCLFDNLGHVFLEPLPTRKVPHWMLCLFGRLMKPQKN